MFGKVLHRCSVSDATLGFEAIVIGPGTKSTRHAVHTRSQPLGNRESSHKSQQTGLTFGDRSSTFPLRLSVLNQLVKHTSRWVSQPALNPSITLLFQESSGSRQCSSGSRGTDKRIELAAVGLLPDLGTGRGDVSTSVGGIVELVCPDGIVEGFGISRSLVVVVLRVVKCDG